MASLDFVTLGPQGTNHELVTRKYLAFHGLSQASLHLADTADAALRAVRSGACDYLVICAVHPHAPAVVGRFFSEVFVVDTFVSPSLPLAVLTRREVGSPRSIGVLHPSTSDYVDTGAWEEVVPITEGTLHTVAQGLLEGRYDSGLVYLDYADRHPDRLRVDRCLGSPDDAWLVLGRERAYRDPILAWPDSPARRQFAQRLAR